MFEDSGPCKENPIIRVRHSTNANFYYLRFTVCSVSDWGQGTLNTQEQAVMDPVAQMHKM